MRTRSGLTRSPIVPKVQTKARTEARKAPILEKNTTRGRVSDDTKADSTDVKIDTLYKNVASSPSFSAKISEFLRQNYLHSTHRRVVKHKFPRRRVLARFPFELFMADLIDYKKYMYSNNHYRYILLLIDCFTRVIYAAPLKRKDQTSTAEALESIFRNFDKFPINFVTDDGKEFFNQKVQLVFRTYGINHYSTPTKTKMKASLAERAIRTIKSRLQKVFTLKKRSRWIDLLDKIVENYNKTPHRSIGMAPSDVNDHNRDKVYKRLYPKESLTVVCKLKVGDKVRKIIEKETFEKGYTENWSSQVYLIDSVRQSNTVCYYKLKTLSNKELPGIYYYYQLNLVSRNDNQPQGESNQ